MHQDRTAVIGLLWHSVNSDNLGIGALTAGHIALIEEVARDLGRQARFVVMGWKDLEPDYVVAPNLAVFRMRATDIVDPRGLYRVARACDVVLDISAGDSFADIYGPRRFALNALSKFVVLAAKRPLVLAPQTIGPFQRRWTRRVAGAVMRRAYAVVARDELTREFLRKFHLGSRVLEATDVAFCLPYERAPSNFGGMTRFGFNVSGLLYNGGYSRDNMFSLRADYREFVREVLKYFTALPECEVHLIGHVNSRRMSVEDDYGVLKNLTEEFPKTILAPRFRSPSEAKTYISWMDFFCGSRMHACIAAHSSGVPHIPIAYSRKFAGVFGSIGYESIGDCRTQTAGELFKEVLKAFNSRDELGRKVARGQSIVEIRLSRYKALLSELLTTPVAHG